MSTESPYHFNHLLQVSTFFPHGPAAGADNPGQISLDSDYIHTNEPKGSGELKTNVQILG